MSLALGAPDTAEGGVAAISSSIASLASFNGHEGPIVPALVESLVWRMLEHHIGQERSVRLKNQC